MLALGRRDPSSRMTMNLGLWGVVVNVMNCRILGLDRSRGFGSARGRFQRVAIGFCLWTRPYKSANTTVLHVIRNAVKGQGTASLYSSIMKQPRSS